MSRICQLTEPPTVSNGHHPVAPTLHEPTRVSRRPLVFALALCPTLTGCLEMFCEGDVVEKSQWVGSSIQDPVVSAAGDTALALWSESGTLHTAGIANRGEVLNEREHHDPFLNIKHVASAPTGHLFVVGDPWLRAWTFDAAGVPATSEVTISPETDIRASSAVFDGTSFLVAWTEPDAMKLSALAPGGDTASTPITIGPGLAANQRLVMASSDGVTWIAWAEAGRVLGVRVASGGPIDPAPVVIVDDPRIPANPACSIASSNGRFLVAVQSERSDSLLVALDGQGNIGTTVEVLDTVTQTLVGEPSGFALLRRSYGLNDMWTPQNFVILRFAPDATYLFERTYSGMGAALTSDGTGLVLALVVKRKNGDMADSVLSLEAVAGGGQLEVARTRLSLETTSHCKEDSI